MLNNKYILNLEKDYFYQNGTITIIPQNISHTTISNGMQKNACEYMLQTEETMDQIARKVGFTTVSTFNRNFKKFLDISPYQWKIKPDNYERKLQNYHITALKGW